MILGIIIAYILSFIITYKIFHIGCNLAYSWDKDDRIIALKFALLPVFNILASLVCIITSIEDSPYAKKRICDWLKKVFYIPIAVGKFLIKILWTIPMKFLWKIVSFFLLIIEKIPPSMRDDKDDE